MNSILSLVDTVYYESKYGLEFNNKKEAIEHYIKIGKQKGYFPNREAEIFHYKTMNFDPEYYNHKYCLNIDNNSAIRHWKLYGSKQGHYVNYCDEKDEHIKFICKCKIKESPSSYSNISNKTYIEQLNEHLNDKFFELNKITSLDSHHEFIFSEKDTGTKDHDKMVPNKLNEMRIHNSENQINDDEYKNQDDNQGNSEVIQDNQDNIEFNQGNSEVIQDNTEFNQENSRCNQSLQLPNENYHVEMTSTLPKQNMCKIKGIMTKNVKSIYDSKILMNKHKLNLNKYNMVLKQNATTDIKYSNNVVKDKFSEKCDKLQIDNTSQNSKNISDKSNNSGNEPDGFDEISFFEEFIDNRYKIVSNKKIKSSDGLTILTQEKSTVNKNIFDTQMDIIRQNISNIKMYLNMCNIHLDTYITLLKQANQYMTDICNSKDNYVMYNASNVKLCTMLKEAEKIIESAHYNNLPIFYSKQPDIKPPNVIKFPLLLCKNDIMNKFLLNNVGNENVYFKIKLMKVSLKYLRLEKYILQSLKINEKITNDSSPIPPSTYPIGETPQTDWYSDEKFIEYWNPNYHLTQFEKAIYKVTMAKESLCNYSKLLEIKEELLLKIKTANNEKLLNIF